MYATMGGIYDNQQNGTLIMNIIAKQRSNIIQI